MVTSSICVAAPAVSAAAGSSSAEAKAALNSFIVMLARPFVCYRKHRSVVPVYSYYTSKTMIVYSFLCKDVV